VRTLPPAAVTFDFGNTLTRDVDFEPVRQARVDHILAWLEERGAAADADSVRAAFESAGEAGARSWSSQRRHFGAGDALAHILSTLHVQSEPAERAPLVALLEDPLPERRLVAVDGVAEALRDLREAGMRLGVVSNLAWGPGTVMRRHLAVHGLLDLFEQEAVAFSDEVGVLKPHPDLFLAALTALGVQPERAAHVGDLKLTDVAGARELGMLTVRYRGVHDDPADAPDADIVIDDYGELSGALGL
jgi:FMN phosphatase YigB (HAD superfamily)